ncbi:MAG: hypothetical protein ACK4P1_03765 [Aggregatilineales bacterium]
MNTRMTGLPQALRRQSLFVVGLVAVMAYVGVLLFSPTATNAEQPATPSFAEQMAARRGYPLRGRDISPQLLNELLPPPPLDAQLYEVREQLSNGWTVPLKKRWLWLPEGQAIRLVRDSEGRPTLSIPSGALWWKEFYMQVGDQQFLVERRITRRTQNGWTYYTSHYVPPEAWQPNFQGAISLPMDSQGALSYVFAADEWLPTSFLQPDLEIRLESEGVEYPYVFPGRVQCAVCHAGAAGAYPNGSRDPIAAFGLHPNNLTPASYRALVERGWLVDTDALLTSNYPDGEANAAQDAFEAKTQQLVAVMRNNCLSCHNPNSLAQGNITAFVLDPNRAYTGDELIEALSVRGRMVAEPHPLVTPGELDKSEVMLRLLGIEGRRRMPPVEGGLPDQDEHILALWREWIELAARR